MKPARLTNYCFRSPSLSVFCLGVWFCFTLSGCDDGKRLAAVEARAAAAEKELIAVKNQRLQAVSAIEGRLDLARKKSDLDGMYLALRELSSTASADTNLTAELQKVDRGIQILQKIRLARAEHDHEQVVFFADEILDIFPQHPEARQSFKESGLIFRDLEGALASLNSCFEKEQSGKVVLVVLKEQGTNSPTETKTDFSKVLFNLNEADTFVQKALALDPQFEPALKVKKTIDECRDTCGLLICSTALPTIAAAADAYTEVFNGIYQLLEINAESRYGDSPATVWAAREAKISDFKNSMQPIMNDLDHSIGFLGDLKSSRVSQLAETVRDMHVQLQQLQDAVTNPRGNMVDYKNSVNKVVASLTESVARLKQSIPNENNISSSIQGFVKFSTELILFKHPEGINRTLEKRKDVIKA